MAAPLARSHAARRDDRRRGRRRVRRRRVGDRCGAIAFDAQRDAAGRAAPVGRRAPSCKRSSTSSPSASTATTQVRSPTVGAAKRALVLVLTDLLEETAARPLLDALPMLARRHAVAVASAVDADLAGPRCVEPPRERARRLPDGGRPRRRAPRASASPRLCDGAASTWSRRPPTSSPLLACAPTSERRLGRGSSASEQEDERPVGAARCEPDREHGRKPEPRRREEALDQPGERRATARCRARPRSPRAPRRRARRRVCGSPGSISAQPMRSPAAPATTMHDSSSTPCAVTSSKKTRPLPLPTASPPTTPEHARRCRSGAARCRRRR